jgi:hypothetical protein
MCLVMSSAAESQAVQIAGASILTSMRAPIEKVHSTNSHVRRLINWRRSTALTALPTV